MKQILKNTTFQISAAIFGGLMLIGLLVAIVFNNDEPKEIPETAAPAKSPESFTFFDLGSNTVFGKEIRERLSEKLGSDAIENWTTLDLEISHKEILPDYFPKLDELNKKLNDSAGARVEHNTIQLTYRYPQKKNTVFNYVRLIFSNYSKKPLVFKIISKKGGSDIVETIKGKYGKPTVLNPAEETVTIFYWKYNRDVFVIARIPDRYGNPEYHIGIYYVNNIEELIQMELKEIAKREEEKRKAGKTAF